MSLGCRCLVLLPDLDSLIAFCCDHTEPAAIEFDIENTGLAREGSRLHSGFHGLEVVPAPPVKEGERTIISPAD